MLAKDLKNSTKLFIIFANESVMSSKYYKLNKKYFLYLISKLKN